jgi:hypothetical protein
MEDRGRWHRRSEGGSKQRVRVQHVREIGDGKETWMIRRQAWMGGAAAPVARSPYLSLDLADRDSDD